MEHRLLVDLEAIALLDSLPRKVRMRLLDQFGRLRATPEQLCDYHEHDSVSRRIEINIFAGYAIHSWIDVADRHIKVLSIRAAG